ncbi:MAG: hypothetical protein IPM16_21045 [Chloroflexi bacterium]|nr:hypothetical protein [Chloroflexota bacterium]
MVDRQLISQLQSINASQRREAIIALGRTKDREAIPHLSRVVEIDPDEALRELARKAAIYIDKHAPVVNVKPFKMPWDDLEEDEEELDTDADAAQAAEGVDAILASYTPPSPEEVSAQQDLEWAERYIERAWQAYYTDDKAGAESNLRKAFEKSPAIADNPNAREAAGKIMNMNADRAVAALLKPHTQRRPASMSKKPATSSAQPASKTRKTGVAAAVLEGRTGKTVDEIEDGNFGRALLDLFVYFAIAFVIGFATIYLFAQFLSTRYDLNNPAAANDPSVQALSPVLEAITGEQGVVNSAGYAAVSAASNAVTFLITSFVTHLVAVTLLGGNGTMPRLIRKTFLYYALVNPVLVILIVVAAFLAALIDFVQVLTIAIGVLSVGAILFLAWRISVAYRFDIGRGCMTMILTVIGYVCLGASLVFILVALGVGPFAQLAQSFG